MPGGQAFRGAGAARDPSTRRGTCIPRTRGSLRRKRQRVMPPGAAEPVCGAPTASQMLAWPGNAPSGWRAWQRGPLKAGAPGVSLAEGGEVGRCQDNFIAETCHPQQSFSDPSPSRLQGPPLWPALRSPSTSPASWPRFPACRSPWAHVDPLRASPFPSRTVRLKPPELAPPAPCFQLLMHSDAAHIADGHLHAGPGLGGSVPLNQALPCLCASSLPGAWFSPEVRVTGRDDGRALAGVQVRAPREGPRVGSQQHSPPPSASGCPRPL